MKKWLIILTFVLVSGCTQTLDIDVKHNPVLQLDAVFYANEPLPLIEIKQSFETTGTRLYEIPLTDLLITGAEVVLKWNGKPIAVTEEALGKYRGQSTDSVRMGDVFEIEVQHKGRLVTSRAEVPVYDLGLIRFKSNEVTRFSAEEAYTRDSIPDTVAVRTGRPFLEAAVPFVPDFMAFIWYSLDADLFEETYQASFLGSRQDFHGYRDFYLGENFTNIDSISVYQNHFTYFLEEETPANGIVTMKLGFKIVIPEPIFAEYHNTISGIIVPITITNVEGGVGLFFGAIREEREVEISVPFETL